MFTAEDPYGTRKRFHFCSDLLRESSPRVVLDIGCGTGSQLTRPLAEAFPAIRFVGIDPDETSIRYARSLPKLPNLEFGGMEALACHAKADLIIASEVLEHVEEPGRFLADLCDKLRDEGRMVVTVPNGYGPYELATTFESVLRVLRVYWILRRLKRWLLRQPAPERGGKQDSLAVSPHLSFFTFRTVLRLFKTAGLEVLEYRPRTFLCGFAFDKFLLWTGRCKWNAAFADRLPPWCNSAWMFVVSRTDVAHHEPYRRGRLTQLRRRLNETCVRIS